MPRPSLFITRGGHLGFCDSGGLPVAIRAVFHFEVRSVQAAEPAFAFQRPCMAAFGANALHIGSYGHLTRYSCGQPKIIMGDVKLENRSSGIASAEPRRGNPASFVRGFCCSRGRSQGNHLQGGERTASVATGLPLAARCGMAEC
jgi:hypothetical protein